MGFLARAEGQGIVEYAFILILVAVLAIGILMVIGPSIGNVFSTIIAATGGG